MCQQQTSNNLLQKSSKCCDQEDFWDAGALLFAMLLLPTNGNGEKHKAKFLKFHEYSPI
jgi:hypothetical protein